MLPLVQSWFRMGNSRIPDPPVWRWPPPEMDPLHGSCTNRPDLLRSTGPLRSNHNGKKAVLYLSIYPCRSKFPQYQTPILGCRLFWPKSTIESAPCPRFSNGTAPPFCGQQQRRCASVARPSVVQVATPFLGAYPRILQGP